jgi:hypothetical protein
MDFSCSPRRSSQHRPATLSYRFFESPFLRWKDQVAERPADFLELGVGSSRRTKR